MARRQPEVPAVVVDDLKDDAVRDGLETPATHPRQPVVRADPEVAVRFLEQREEHVARQSVARRPALHDRAVAHERETGVGAEPDRAVIPLEDDARLLVEEMLEAAVDEFLQSGG
jgi:hypothetical protein